MSNGRRPTMRDVAREAGVSFKTVSRVVNHESGVREELTAQVAKAIADLGYRPDHRARGLRSADQAAVTIGFILVDVANPFFGSLLRGIEEIAATRGCLVLAGSTEGSGEREQVLIDALIGRRVDGLIVVTSGADTQSLESEIERGTPVVFVDIEPDLTDIDLVRSDHFEGARAATEHLMSFGHTDIAYFGDDPRLYSATLRFDGFLAAMTAGGHDVAEDRIVTGSWSEDDWKALALERLQRSSRPTAIFSAQNFVTIGVARALHELGLQRSIAQIGFDDIDLADVVEPGISVVPQRPRALGRLAAELLFRRIDGDVSPSQHQVVAVPIIARGSGEIPRPS